MPRQDAPTQAYGRVAIGLHWLTAALVFAAIALGLTASAADTPQATERALALHKSLGLAIFASACIRLAWRLIRRPPPMRSDLPRIQRVAAKVTHAMLYATILAMPIAGYVAVAARGRATYFFGLFEMPYWVPLSRALSQNATTIHVYGQYILYVLVAAHVGAALFHHYVRKDDVMRRMWPRATSNHKASPQPSP
jgi:cytochrome b561